MNKPPDLELINRIRAGDQKAEEELLTRFKPRIVKKVQFSLSTKNEDWRDVVHEIEIALLENLRNGKFNPEKISSLGSYVYGITLNKIRYYFKMQKGKENLRVFDDESYIAEQDEPNIEREEVRKILRGVINKLEIKYKEILYLRYYENMKVTEISQHINLPEEKVRDRLKYALKLLRKECMKKNIFSLFLKIYQIYL
jgi:RNA polymerase sigma-70 factor (ECF subfamily)